MNEERVEPEEIRERWGAPIASEQCEAICDGVVYHYAIPIYERDGVRRTMLDDAERSELRVAQAMVRNRHQGGEGLRFMRKACGVTIARMAEALEVTEKTVRRWETNESEAGAATRAAYYRMIAEACGGKPPLQWLEEQSGEPLKKEVRLDPDPADAA